MCDEYLFKRRLVVLSLWKLKYKSVARLIIKLSNLEINLILESESGCTNRKLEVLRDSPTLNSMPILMQVQLP